METLTISDLNALAEILRFAQTGAKVARVTEDLNPSARVIYGVARSLGDENGMFLGSNDDVRDAHLRVTTQSGFEAFWRVRDLIPEVNRSEFVAYDWS